MERGKDNDDCNNENKNQQPLHRNMTVIPPNQSRSQNRMRRNNSSSRSSSNNNSTTSSDSEDDSSLQDALATSSALVGENVLDSPIPSSHHKHHHHHHHHQNKSNHNLCMPSLPATMPSSSSSQTTATTTTSTYPNSTLNANHHHATTTIKSDDFSVGLMAQGLAWVRRQRERRQRLYLQNQAEEQLRILQEATLTPAQHQQHAHSSSYSYPWDNPCTGSRGLLDNSTFQSLATSHSSNTSQQQLSCTESKEKQMFSSSSLLDDPTCISNYPSASSSALAADHDERSTVPVVSPSGDGYTVNLPSSVTDVDEQEDASWIPPVRVQEPSATTAGAIDSTVPPYLLTPAQMQQIATHVLPRGISYCKWTRLYSLARDGDSFDACLRLLQGQKNTLLVLRTSRNHILGGFADQPWDKARNMPGSASYYGGPDACLFTFAPPLHSSSNADDKVRFYKWTGANRYIQLCDVAHKMLAFGGGGEEGDFGLCVEQDFQRGSTGHCATFDNDPLCDPDTFSILDVEIYGFLLGQF